jgi:uncharacterized protein (DUF433 family)
MKKRKSTARQLGRYVVADPEICHGKPTFRGTRIFVADVLEQVAEGLAWETIIEEWRGTRFLLMYMSTCWIRQLREHPG